MLRISCPRACLMDIGMGLGIDITRCKQADMHVLYLLSPCRPSGMTRLGPVATSLQGRCQACCRHARGGVKGRVVIRVVGGT